MNVDLRRFVPSWAAQGLKVPEDSSSHGAWQGLADAIKANPGAEAEEVGLLAWNQWSAAIELYGIAAVACGQWSLAALFAHKQVVLQVLAARPRTGLFLGFCFECSQVAVAAPLQGRSATLALFYDRVRHTCCSLAHSLPTRAQVAREQWSERRAGGMPFELEKAVTVIDPVILRLAEQAYDKSKARSLCCLSAAERAGVPSVRGRAPQPPAPRATTASQGAVKVTLDPAARVASLCFRTRRRQQQRQRQGRRRQVCRPEGGRARLEPREAYRPLPQAAGRRLGFLGRQAPLGRCRPRRPWPRQERKRRQRVWRCRQQGPAGEDP